MAEGLRPNPPPPEMNWNARVILRAAIVANLSTERFQLHHDLFEKIPVHLMFRYNFVPLRKRRTDGWPSQSPIPAS
jgi:hypothetical protein